MAWRVHLVGDSADLRMLADALREPSFSISQEDGEFVLTSSEFASITSADEVRARANELVTSLSGLARLMLRSHGPISVGELIVDPKGRRHFELQAETGAYRVEGYPASLTIQRTDGTLETDTPLHPVRECVFVAGNDPAVTKALRLRNGDDLTWGDLYRLYEVVEADVGGLSKIAELGWTRQTQVKRFKRTANSEATAGDEARHGSETSQPPQDPMKLPEARELVDRLLKHWLRSKAESLRQNPSSAT